MKTQFHNEESRPVFDGSPTTLDAENIVRYMYFIPEFGF